MKNQRTFSVCYLTLALFCLANLLDLCPSTGWAEQASSPSFRVGVILPLSGPLAEYGIAAKNGFELAIRDKNTNTKNIDFFFEDSRWEAKRAVSAFNNLRTQKKVSLIFNWGNPTSEAIAPLAERYRLPMLAMSLDPKVGIARNYVIRATNSSRHFSKKLADYLKQVGHKRLAVIISQNTYVQGLYNELKAHLSSEQKIEIIDTYNLSDSDFRTSITKLRIKNFDAIGVFLISGQVSTFYQQMTEQNVFLPSFGTDFFESKTEIKLAGRAIEGAVYPHLGISNEFRKDYIKRYGNDYQIAYAGNAYDIASLLGKYFANPSSELSAKQIVERLKIKESHQGICGQFSFKETDQDGPFFEFPVRLKQIKSQSIKVLN